VNIKRVSLGLGIRRRLKGIVVVIISRLRPYTPVALLSSLRRSRTALYYPAKVFRRADPEAGIDCLEVISIGVSWREDILIIIIIKKVGLRR
jgi:hypothetical protein